MPSQKDSEADFSSVIHLLSFFSGNLILINLFDAKFLPFPNCLFVTNYIDQKNFQLLCWHIIIHSYLQWILSPLDVFVEPSCQCLHFPLVCVFSSSLGFLSPLQCHLRYCRDCESFRPYHHHLKSKATVNLDCSLGSRKLVVS